MIGKPPMSKRQVEVFEFVKNFITTKGVSPTIRELAEGINVASTNSVRHYLDVLEKRNLIHAPTGKARSITLCGDRCPVCNSPPGHASVKRCVVTLEQTSCVEVAATLQYQ